ncbi:MAG: thiol protease/hemagglutinin PrtT [Bacteroidetes bacterium]|nr:thiol protease/hemagglutinin PrtT [Bacteroidota bacterium]MBU1581077.1 thiol protease/hemagglutinin PrtT [Bacteroidota bacterium]MBU2465104.1 thiol protease/hemagglutinin PrtT [Bacteroidota bacterium]MBU2557630.1 thiol protease/hemagglutinin PrtT [Bacteroidota bacterium]
MKKAFLTLFLALVGISMLFAKSVDQEKAKIVATHFLKSYNQSFSSEQLTLFKTIGLPIADPFNYYQSSYTPLIYVFNYTDNGFILVSADDIAEPILGYTFKHDFSEEAQPYAFSKWIEGYKNQLAYAIENGWESTQAVKNSWENLLQNNYIPVTRAVNPLLSTTWDQSPHYNAQCPGGSVTGCVATAMAQVMKYWNHPAQGTGMHSYNHATYGTLSANFGATTYNWSAMPNNVSSSNDAVATLMYHCGVSVDMDYSPQVSGAWVVEADDPVCSESALKNYFGYSSSLQGVKRDNNYSTAQWTALIKGELDAGRPVLYAGFGSGGGHAFVCDGYNNSNYFHFNWGWGGYYDGYFLIDALNPGGTGTGGGTGGYNGGHQALIGVVPASGGGGGAEDLVLYAPVNITPNPIQIGDAFSIYTDIANVGDEVFQGDFGALIFDNQYNPVDFVAILQGYSMEPQTHFTNGITFSTNGMSNLLPGNYFVGILFRPLGQDWDIVGNGDYNNLVAFQVANSSQIELYSAMTVTGSGQLTQNQQFSVQVALANYGDSDFYGNIDLSFYNLDGSFAETVQAFNNVVLESGYYYNVTFASSGTSLTPGNYYLAIQHAANGGSWTLSGSTYYPNPIQVIVQAQGITADQFEPNNHTTSASNLALNWNNNIAHITTNGSNNHEGLDYDCYKIDIPNGYSYTINARVHDSYNSGNGQVYTNDVIWSYSTGLGWQGSYDDVMPSPLVLQTGGTIHFLVSPYFLGETGTYLLEIQIDRNATNTAEIVDQNRVTIYPNPTSDLLFIKNDQNIEFTNFGIYNLKGERIISQPINDKLQNTQAINLKNLPSGSYFLKLESAEKTISKPIIKHNK